MKKIFNTVLVATLMIVGSTQAWAATMTLNASPVEGGVVLINASSVVPDPSDSRYASTFTITQNSGNVYPFAKANQGYIFRGCTKIETNNFGSVFNGTPVAIENSTYYAIFEYVGYEGEAISKSAKVGEELTAEAVVKHLHAGTLTCKMKDGSASEITVALQEGTPASSTNEWTESTLEIKCNTEVEGEYTGTVVVNDQFTKFNVMIDVTFTVSGTTTGVNAVSAQKNVRKEIRNGALIIRSEDAEYSVMGQVK